MRLNASYELKAYRSTWSDQSADIKTKDGVDIHIIIAERECDIEIMASDSAVAKEYLYLIWELLAIYDGYFYKPLSLFVDDVEQSIETLYRVSFYITDTKWVQSAQLLGRNNRGLTADILETYRCLRNKDRKSQSMEKTMINSYFYLLSDAYKNIGIEHRLVLMMHLCDGIAIAHHNGSTKNDSGNINKIVNLLCTKKYKEGAALLDIDSNKAMDALGNTRNQLTHYNCDPQKRSLGDYISDPDKETDSTVNLYVFYVLEVAFRVALLSAIGYTVTDDVKEYVMDENLDWIKLVKGLDEKCAIPINQLKQAVMKLSSTFDSGETVN